MFDFSLDQFVVEQCNVSSDCVIDGVAKVCYTEVTFSEHSYFCNCSNWHGWIGETCSETSAQLHLHQGSLAGLLLWSFLLLGLYVKHSVLYCRARRKYQARTIAQPFYLTLLNTTAVVLFLGGFSVLLPTVIDPTFVKIGFFDSSEDGQETVLYEFEELSVNLIAVGFVFLFLSMVQISITWLQLADSVQQYIFKKDSYARLGLRLTRCVQISFVFFFVVAVVCMVLRFFRVLLILSSTLILLGFPLLIIGRQRLLNAVRRVLKPGDNHLQQTRHLINFSTSISIVTSGLSSAFTFAHVLSFEAADMNVVPGNINYSMLCQQLVYFTALAKLSGDFWYLKLMLKRVRLMYKVDYERTHAVKEKSIAQEVSRRSKKPSSVNGISI